jgi:hypothetical protein
VPGASGLGQSAGGAPMMPPGSGAGGANAGQGTDASDASGLLEGDPAPFLPLESPGAGGGVGAGVGGGAGAGAMKPAAWSPAGGAKAADLAAEVPEGGALSELPGEPALAGPGAGGAPMMPPGSGAGGANAGQGTDASDASGLLDGDDAPWQGVDAPGQSGVPDGGAMPLKAASWSPDSPGAALSPAAMRSALPAASSNPPLAEATPLGEAEAGGGAGVANGSGLPMMPPSGSGAANQKAESNPSDASGLLDGSADPWLGAGAPQHEVANAGAVMELPASWAPDPSGGGGLTPADLHGAGLGAAALAAGLLGAGPHAAAVAGSVPPGRAAAGPDVVPNAAEEAALAGEGGGTPMSPPMTGGSAAGQKPESEVSEASGLIEGDGAAWLGPNQPGDDPMAGGAGPDASASWAPDSVVPERFPNAAELSQAEPVRAGTAAAETAAVETAAVETAAAETASAETADWTSLPAEPQQAWQEAELEAGTAIAAISVLGMLNRNRLDPIVAESDVELEQNPLWNGQPQAEPEAEPDAEPEAEPEPEPEAVEDQAEDIAGWDVGSADFLMPFIGDDNDNDAGQDELVDDGVAGFGDPDEFSEQFLTPSARNSAMPDRYGAEFAQPEPFGAGRLDAGPEPWASDTAELKTYQRRTLGENLTGRPLDVRPTCSGDDTPPVDPEAKREQDEKDDEDGEDEKPMSMSDFLSQDDSAWGGGGSASSGIL